MSTDELSFDQRGLPVMSLVRVHNFSVSLDGFSTGADQSLEAPFGHAGDRLVRWFMGTRSFHVTTGQEGGSTGIDDAFASNWGPGVGVEIMGRNKFGPQRGPWTDEEWKGWWGEEPPFHTPVFVLTHHVRPSIEMKGGTAFRFIDASPAQALAAARQAAGGLEVRIGGGPATVRQFLAADLIDHMHVVVVPILLGRGESLWDGLEGLEERFAIESVRLPQRRHPRHVHPSLAALRPASPNRGEVWGGPRCRDPGRSSSRCSTRTRAGRRCWSLNSRRRGPGC
jgi:dihydrofolate reductase